MKPAYGEAAQKLIDEKVGVTKNLPRPAIFS
jgi:hypothetical protein